MGTERDILIPVMRPKLPDFRVVKPYLEKIDARRVYSNNGPLVQALESRYAEFLGVNPDQVVACSSGTSGLTGAIQLASADEFLVQDFTFAATPLAVLASGKHFAFVDISAEDLCSVQKVREGRSYVITLPFGSGFDLVEGLASFPGEVVIDAAASIGNSAGALNSMPPEWTVVFSLHATKVLGVGEGGLVVFGDTSKADEFRSWINFGYDQGKIASRAGSNAKMSEIVSAYGHAALDYADEEFQDWAWLRTHAIEISNAVGLNKLNRGPQDISPYWIAKFDSQDELVKVEEHLATMGIDSRRWWSSACHQMPVFKGVEKFGSLENSSVAASTHLGLPLFRGQTADDFLEIRDALEDAFRLI